MAFVLDRFEEQCALLQNLDNGTILTLARAEIPQDTREGDVLSCKDGSWQRDEDETARRAQRIRARMERLFED